MLFTTLLFVNASFVMILKGNITFFIWSQRNPSSISLVALNTVVCIERWLEIQFHVHISFCYSFFWPLTRSWLRRFPFCCSISSKTTLNSLVCTWVGSSSSSWCTQEQMFFCLPGEIIIIIIIIYVTYKAPNPLQEVLKARKRRVCKKQRIG